MRHIPYITLVAAALFFAGPYGRDILYGAFWSNEQISNSIAQFLLLVVLAAVLAFMLLEWTVKFYWRRRRGKINSTLCSSSGS